MQNNLSIDAMKFPRWMVITISLLLLVYGARQLLTMTFWPYQNEYREASAASNAYELLSGHNPYSFEEQPRFTNVYGIAFPVVTAAVAMSPSNSFIATRIISALFIVVNCALLFWWVKRKTSLDLGLVTIVLFFFQQLYSASGAYPMSLGIFFFLVPILLIDIFGWSKKLLAISFLSALLGFLTKPYFVVNVAWVGLLSILVMPIRIVLSFAGLSALGFLIALLMIDHMLPAYFNNVFFVNLATATWDPDYLASQLKLFWHQNWAIFACMALSVAGLILLRRRSKTPLPHLSTWIADPSLIAALGGFLIFYTKLGGHTGAAPAHYLYNLCSPFYLVIAAKLFHFTATAAARKGYFWAEYCKFILAGSFLVSSLGMPNFQQHIEISPEQTSDWETVRDFIANSNNPFVSPSMASLVLQNGRPLYDSGMSEYFSFGSIRRGLIGSLFAANPDIVKRQSLFKDEIQHDIMAQRYDLIALTSGYSPFADLALVREYYYFCKSVRLAMPLAEQEWETVIYLPKGSAPRSSQCTYPESIP